MRHSLELRNIYEIRLISKTCSTWRKFFIDLEKTVKEKVSCSLNLQRVVRKCIKKSYDLLLITLTLNFLRMKKRLNCRTKYRNDGLIISQRFPQFPMTFLTSPLEYSFFCSRFHLSSGWSFDPAISYTAPLIFIASTNWLDAKWFSTPHGYSKPDSLIHAPVVP